MSDERLRDLERRWSQTASVEDEVELLSKRLRTGELSRPWVELAAYVGHPAAKLVLGDSVFNLDRMGWSYEVWPRDMERADFRFLVMGLDLWGVPVLVRGLIALSRLALRRFLQERPQETRPEAYLLAAEAWVIAPGERTLLALEREGESFSELSMEVFRIPPGPERGLLDPLLHTIEEPSEVIHMAALGRHPRLQQGDTDRRRRLWIESVRDHTVAESTEAIRRELVPFALGYSDPVRERVKARRSANES